MLATGTADHGPLAELLWRKGVPYVAACAYPQARFFEVMPVIPAEATPCLSCFRGHLYRGIESSGTRDSVFVQNLHHTEHAYAVAVLVRR